MHNAGAIQNGTCFEVLVGDDGRESWVAADETVPFQRWYWPLDGYQADDDTCVLFVAEMHEHGGGYLQHTTPERTWTVEIDLDDPGAAGDLERAPDSTDSLYGFEITEDDEYRYFYAQCHRQFGHGVLGHDECASEVTIARQPLDWPDVPFEYWDGERWQRNSTPRVPRWGQPISRTNHPRIPTRRLAWPPNHVNHDKRPFSDGPSRPDG